MAESASRNHGYADTRCGSKGRYQERGFVANSAGRMLVRFWFWNVREIEHVARVQHHRRICIYDEITALVRQPYDTREQLQAISVLPLRIVIRKVNTEITFA